MTSTAEQIDYLKSVFENYLGFVGDTESPAVYHRWAFLSGIGTAIGRGTYLPFGHGAIHANTYSVLIGAAGTRKSTAISHIKKLLKLSGYDSFAADRTSKEKFLVDLQELNTRNMSTDGLLNMDIDDEPSAQADILIAADELQDFMGQNNIDFITMLGVLWDCKPTYENRIKHGKSTTITNHYVSLLGGSTQTGFALAFPPEIVTQGFLSRLLLIYGERTSRRIAFPKVNTHDSSDLIDLVAAIHNKPDTALTISDAAVAAAEDIYRSDFTIGDPRFESYDQRRYTHMLKLAVICSQLRLADEISEADILVAHTMLAAVERKMEYALGEFGKAKNAEITTLLLESMRRSEAPQDINDLWKVVATDLQSQGDLHKIVQGLLAAGRIKTLDLPSGTAFVEVHKKLDHEKDTFRVDGFISEAELNFEI